uniref:4-hydroxy-4-methyl-2-oxoglutarate aldolase tasA n=1 Tax=Hapsidospora irregularis TaxID=95324 RepID=TASA_HAPIR|nr:RecName: Full=4-hydroxy-4-methyl-2-oxoglutarate aldolase tasA; AltName: Full=Tetramic acid Sch210971/2 biosynthesis cluster protein A [Hapsidospora irregularis]AKG54861.1 HpcH/HpaI aldolase [Hapsidospora irregularis]
MVAYENVLANKASSGRLCKALGIRLVTNPLVVQLAKNAGFDALFIDLEHSTLSLADASAIACAGLLSGLTPFVRVPYQCGMGFVQQVLDGGAMGIIFPHVHTAADARAAVDTCKFPPHGRRSMWGQQPVLGLRVTPLHKIAEVCDRVASSVVVMIEAADSIEQADAIAAVEGVDVLLVGCIDLSTDMGIAGNFESKRFRAALEAVSAACHRHGKLMGLAGLYNNRKLQEWAVHSLRARFILCQQDSNLLALGAMECAGAVASIQLDRCPD